MPPTGHTWPEAWPFYVKGRRRGSRSLGPHREIVPARVEFLSDPGVDLAFQKGRPMNNPCHRPVGNPAF